MHMSTMWRALGDIFCNNDPKVRAKMKKAGICQSVPSTAVVVVVVLVILKLVSLYLVVKEIIT